eukprot:10435516-Alexandrium_andersonii.AAC.1
MAVGSESVALGIIRSTRGFNTTEAPTNFREGLGTVMKWKGESKPTCNEQVSRNQLAMKWKGLAR